MRANTLDQLGQENTLEQSVAELCELAASGLVEMFDPERQLFCHAYTRTQTGMRRQGLSHRYTMMTLLGLHSYERSGRRLPLAIAPIFDALIRDTNWIASTGDLGLLLWTCAELVPDRLPEIYKKFRASEALNRFPDGQQGCTMEVAWYLTGLATCWRIGYSDLPQQAEQIAGARQILLSNCGRSGIYGHLARPGSLKGHIRRGIGSFADQVYPTIALARLSQVLNDPDARERAQRTATTMCQLQAPLGEWPWHYDSGSGRVVSRYPVYSVHQHAMAPMMLFATAEATGCDFNGAIYKGLAWINGNNELHRDFIEPSLNLVWRCIYLRPRNAYVDAAQRYLGIRDGVAAAQPQIRYECRPYELGWLLYAFAERHGARQAA